MKLFSLPATHLLWPCEVMWAPLTTFGDIFSSNPNLNHFFGQSTQSINVKCVVLLLYHTSSVLHSHPPVNELDELTFDQ